MIRLNTFQLVDFEVYYKAGERVYQGITPYQHVEDGHFIYKYSPVFALAMIPFSWVNYTIAKWIYLFLLFICFYSSCTILLKEVEAKKNWVIIVLSLLLIFSKHLVKEIYLGQINIIILALLVYSLYFKDLNGKLSSFILASSLFIKPIGIVLIPYFILKQKWNWLGYFFLWILLMILISLCFIDLRDYQMWFVELRNELASKTDLYSIDTQTIFASIRRILHINKPIATIFGISIWSGINFYGYRKLASFFPFFLISTVPLLVCTSNNFYILSIPLFVFLLVKFQSMTPFYKMAFLISALLMCFNQYELWGREGVDKIDYYTPYAISVISNSIIMLQYSEFNSEKL